VRAGRTATALAVIAGALGLLGPTTPAAHAASTCSLEPTALLARTIGACRNYIHVPFGLAGPAPLVLELHGAGQGGRLHARNKNHCPATPTREPGVWLEATRYAPCAAGTEVVWRAYFWESHNWPIGKDRADIQRRMWDLFQRNRLPV
jgi:poly(3-hydroxybutyrate) depolymerase